MEKINRAFYPKPITPDIFHKRIATYSEGAQDAIATLSSMLLERDLLNRIKGNPQELREVISQLKNVGLGIKDILFVMKYFGLPNPNPALQKATGQIQK